MKKHLREILIVTLAILMVFALGACKGSDQVPDDKSSGQQEETADDTQPVSTDKLVVYFSVTGNTKGAAERIAEITVADIYEIVPAVPYTAEDIDYGDSARSRIEQNDPDARPEIGGEDIDLSAYTTIFIGYPIWYGEAPRIMDTFAESHDFSGKTVIPFCTSDNSDIGESGISLGEKAGSGDWKKGKRFAGGVTKEEIRVWLEVLGL